jgi:protein TonB
VRAPLPVNPVTLPAPAPVRQPVASPAPATATPAPAIPSRSSSAAPSTAPGTNPRARQQEADYFSLVSAHLNRRKTYPVEARQARQQGVVTVRFTVDRNGGVSVTSIKRSSGHDVLDQATLALLQRVAPLPRMPATMQRDSVTLSLPIDYTLRTN